jgi:molybdopterin-guanine dinucleotide biosynthesis protein A
MGADKALLLIDGVVLARRVHDALVAAGCDPVVAIGGDPEALGAHGLTVVPDRFPGAGPLGALVTTLEHLADRADIVVVLACDLPDADPRAVRAVCAPFSAPDGADVDVVVPRGDERRHMHHAAWRTRVAPRLAEAFDAGERAPRRVLSRLRVVELPVTGMLDPAWLADLDEPTDLAARLAAARRVPTDPT